MNCPPGVLNQIVVEFDHSMCHKIKFKVNSEGINVWKVVSMPNKVLITCGATYIIRIWTILGLNLWVLNLDYPLPFRWNLMINRFERRKDKYLKALKIQHRIKQKWYKKLLKPKRMHPEANINPLNILEEQNNPKTLKALVSEIKDDKSGILSLRNIDVKNWLNIIMEKKSALDVQIEMLEQNDNPKSTKTHQDPKEEMKQNADEKPIDNIMPVFEVKFEKFGALVDTKIKRRDGEKKEL